MTPEEAQAVPISTIEEGTAHWSVVDMPTTALTPLDVADLPATDKAFTTAEGNKVRMRIVKREEQATDAPAKTGTLAPAALSLGLTIALLDDSHDVAKDANGDYIISNTHELVINQDALSNPTFDIKEFVEQQLGQQAHVFQVRSAKQAATLDYVTNEWGVQKTEPIQHELTPGIDVVPSPPPSEADMPQPAALSS